jgi:hypothetical protein
MKGRLIDAILGNNVVQYKSNKIDLISRKEAF